mmetsp:Transcript_73739/g.149700  ORF Transcript_73739/g.149700 Transcript_73739/m.149700 type:complete len:211 (+) Transcript_73739:444-1076(+)
MPRRVLLLLVLETTRSMFFPMESPRTRRQGTTNRTTSHHFRCRDRHHRHYHRHHLPCAFQRGPPSGTSCTPTNTARPGGERSTTNPGPSKQRPALLLLLLLSGSKTWNSPASMPTSQKECDRFFRTCPTTHPTTPDSARVSARLRSPCCNRCDALFGMLLRRNERRSHWYLNHRSPQHTKQIIWSIVLCFAGFFKTRTNDREATKNTNDR